MLNIRDQFIIKDNLLSGIECKTLNEEQLRLIYDRRWFNIWVPKVYGGLELPLREGCLLLESLAYEDGGFGWTVTLCSGANMFAGFMDPELAGSIFVNRKVCFGGSGKVDGKAVKTADGAYLLTGKWKYATGAPHLSHFTLNAWIYENNKPLYDVAGEPLYTSFFVDSDDVLIHYDWDTFGLETTASHSFSVSELKVAANRAFALQPDKATYNGTLFHYPFMTFAECTLAVNYIGMFKKFLYLFEKQLILRSKDGDWMAKKGKTLFQMVNDIEQPFLNQVDRLYTLMDISWNEVATNDQLLTEIASLSRNLVAYIRSCTVELFPYTGISGAQRDNELNIVFRNLFTASQHGLLNIPADV